MAQSAESDRDGLSAEPANNSTSYHAQWLFAVVAFLVPVTLATQLDSELTWAAGKPFLKQPGFFSAFAVVGMLVFGVLELVQVWRRRWYAEAYMTLGSVGSK